MIEVDPGLPWLYDKDPKRYDLHTRKYVAWDRAEDLQGTRQIFPPLPTKEVKTTKQSRHARDIKVNEPAQRWIS